MLRKWLEVTLPKMALLLRPLLLLKRVRMQQCKGERKVLIGLTSLLKHFETPTKVICIKMGGHLRICINSSSKWSPDNKTLSIIASTMTTRKEERPKSPQSPAEEKTLQQLPVSPTPTSPELQEQQQQAVILPLFLRTIHRCS